MFLSVACLFVGSSTSPDALFNIVVMIPGGLIA